MKETNEQVNILDQLLDEDNEDPITLYDENDKAVRFDQVAIIPYKEKLYAILKPIDEMEGVNDDEAIVFLVEEDDDGDAELTIETDEPTAIKVFDEYYKLLDENAVPLDDKAIRFLSGDGEDDGEDTELTIETDEAQAKEEIKEKAKHAKKK